MDMNNKVMIDNQSGFPMNLVMTYLAGFTTALNGCIEVTTVKGKYYDNVIIKQV